MRLCCRHLFDPNHCLLFTGTGHEGIKHYSFNVRYRKSLRCLQDQFYSINVQKQQRNCCFRQLAAELCRNGTEGVIGINKTQGAVKQNQNLFHPVKNYKQCQ